MPSLFRIESLPRAKGVSNRVVIMGLGGRFMDELLSGLPTVLMPTIRAQFGLSYTQISLLGLTLNYVAAIIEPIGGLLIDLWKRPWLMAWGAAGIGLATAVIGLAPTLGFLLLGFAIYGLASGPLAHTADVDTILELGSGAATGWLAKRGRKMVSIEHNENYLGKHDSTYIHAPMVEYMPGRIWYDRDAVARGIDGLRYQIFVVDGPVPRANRFWLLDHLKLFDLAVPMLVDDVDCDIEDSVYGGLVAMSHRIGTRLYCGGHPERGIEGKWVGTIP
jgi:hypothetical protein